MSDNNPPDEGEQQQPYTKPAETETEKSQVHADKSGATKTEESYGSQVEHPLQITENQMKKRFMKLHVYEDLWIPTEVMKDAPFPWQEIIEPKEGVNYGDVVPVPGNESGQMLIARNIDPSVLKLEGPNGEAYHPVIDGNTDAEGWFYGTGWDHIDKSRDGGRARERVTDKVRRRIWKFGGKPAETTKGLWNRSMFPQLRQGLETEGNVLGDFTVKEAVGQIPADAASAMTGIYEAAGQTAASTAERTASAMAGMKDKVSQWGGYFSWGGREEGGSGMPPPAAAPLPAPGKSGMPAPDSEGKDDQSEKGHAKDGEDKQAASTTERTASAMAGMKDKVSQFFSCGGREEGGSGMPPPAAAPLPAPGGSGMPPPAAAPLPSPGSSGMPAPDSEGKDDQSEKGHAKDGEDKHDKEEEYKEDEEEENAGGKDTEEKSAT